jgi:hypothetical protein
MNIARILASLALCTTVGFGAPASATAILQLIDNEGNFAQVSGDQPTLTLAVNNSSGLFTGSPWSLAIAVGTNGVTGLGVPAIDFDLTAVAARPGSLTAIYSIDNLTYGTGLHNVSVNSFIDSPYTAGIQWQVCIDDGNVLTAQTGCTGYGSADGALALPSAAVDGFFSLTIIGRLADSSSTSLRVAAVQSVPEPMTLVLFGSALLLMGAFTSRARASS